MERDNMSVLVKIINRFELTNGSNNIVIIIKNQYNV